MPQEIIGSVAENVPQFSITGGADLVLLPKECFDWKLGDEGLPYAKDGKHESCPRTVWEPRRHYWDYEFVVLSSIELLGYDRQNADY